MLEKYVFDYATVDGSDEDDNADNKSSQFSLIKRNIGNIYLIFKSFFSKIHSKTQ